MPAKFVMVVALKTSVVSSKAPANDGVLEVGRQVGRGSYPEEVALDKDGEVE